MILSIAAFIGLLGLTFYIGYSVGFRKGEEKGETLARIREDVRRRGGQY